MMRLGIASFTDRGALIARKLADAFSDEYEIVPLSGSLKDWCGQLFASRADGIVFVGACGIAVRTIAPFIESKTSDPAVLVVDEAGQFVISLLSGHLGGANRLAKRAASVLQAVPVITTATDVNGKFAVDVFAADNHLLIGSMRTAKEISAAILKGQRVGFYCEAEIKGELPKELTLVPSVGDAGREPLDALICVSLISPRLLFPGEALPETVLHLVPRCAVLGIGCRKGKSEEDIAALAEKVLSQNGIAAGALVGVASADLKREEPGLIEFCRKRELPFETYSSETLAALAGSFSSSEFVREVAKVDNVCERAALKLAGEGARLIIKKQAENGVTAAVAEKEWSVNFEK